MQTYHSIKKFWFACKCMTKYFRQNLGYFELGLHWHQSSHGLEAENEINGYFHRESFAKSDELFLSYSIYYYLSNPPCFFKEFSIYLSGRTQIWNAKRLGKGIILIFWKKFRYKWLCGEELTFEIVWETIMKFKALNSQI